MKFKIGDRVRVKDNLMVGKRYGDFEFSNGMKRFVGKECHIDLVLKSLKLYTLKEDKKECYQYAFSAEMLEPIEEEYTIKTYGNDDFVIDTTDEQIKIKCDYIHKINDYTVEIDGSIIFKTKSKINNVYKVIA